MELTSSDFSRVRTTDFLIRALLALDERERASTAMDELLSSIDSASSSLAAYTLARLGRREQAQQRLAEMEMSNAQNPSFMLFAYAEMGEAELACEWAHHVIARASPWALRFFGLVRTSSSYTQTHVGKRSWMLWTMRRVHR